MGPGARLQQLLRQRVEQSSGSGSSPRRTEEIGTVAFSLKRVSGAKFRTCVTHSVATLMNLVLLWIRTFNESLTLEWQSSSVTRGISVKLFEVEQLRDAETAARTLRPLVTEWVPACLQR